MRRTPLDSRLLAMVLAIALAVFPPAALGGYRDDMHVTSIEVALLPQFCWRQFEFRTHRERNSGFGTAVSPRITTAPVSSISSEANVSRARRRYR